MALTCAADLEWLVKADSPMLEILKDFMQTRHRAKKISCDTLSSQGRQQSFTNHASLNLHFPIVLFLCKWTRPVHDLSKLKMTPFCPSYSPQAMHVITLHRNPKFVIVEIIRVCLTKYFAFIRIIQTIQANMSEKKIFSITDDNTPQLLQFSLGHSK
jgi:hypothetical protein